MPVLAIDVGGTSTRAAIVSTDGTCVGSARARAGNPTSSGADDAAAAIAEAALAAMAGAAVDPGDVAAGVVAIAGASGQVGAWLVTELVRAGLPEQLTLEADLLAAFCSGSLAPAGYALIAGTGAAAIRVRNGRIEATADGLGWLLGDAGSGFWIGRRAVLAATRDLDDRGPPTALTDLLVAELGLIRSSGRGTDGRVPVLRQLVAVLYGLRPVELSRFAPLVFDAAAAGDDVATGIVGSAGDALAATLTAVLVPDIAGPIVLSGSIVSRQPAVARRAVRSVLTAAEGVEVITVSDGLAGAAVLALRQVGVTVDDSILVRLHGSLPPPVADQA